LGRILKPGTVNSLSSQERGKGGLGRKVKPGTFNSLFPQERRGKAGWAEN
jgi:hypothetical protein